eukprot:13661418-Heterocapsa_arctica.AAC.1
MKEALGRPMYREVALATNKQINDQHSRVEGKDASGLVRRREVTGGCTLYLLTRLSMCCAIWEGSLVRLGTVGLVGKRTG